MPHLPDSTATSWQSSAPVSDLTDADALLLRRQQFAKTLDDALAARPVLSDHPFKVEDLYDAEPPPPPPQPPAPPAAPRVPLWLPAQLSVWLPDLCEVTPPATAISDAPSLEHASLLEHALLPPAAATPPTTVCTPTYLHHSVMLSPPAPPQDLSKPINALGPMCFAGFYLVSLTRTIVRNHTVPHPVRAAFMAPQLHFAFTVRDSRDPKWRHVPTVQIPYHALSAAGEWLRDRLRLAKDHCSFKMVKDALQKAVSDAWADGRWHMLVDALADPFDEVVPAHVEDALACDAVSGRAKGTPPEFFSQVNCHKGAPDIRRDVDGAISARESLRSVLAHLGLNADGCDISVSTFRDDVFPLWKHQCPYVRDHQSDDCCQFYDGGYFKKIMIHKHLYNVDACTSSYHVKDLFEGLDEVIKVWSNPTGMCVREAKCAAGLRYNVDKSFQSGIRSYSKAKFLEAAPHTAHELLELERHLHSRLQVLLKHKQKSYPKCRGALRSIEIGNESLSQRPLPDVLRPRLLELAGRQPPPSPSRKRKRQDRDALSPPSTPREQKRKHAHLSLKRKEAAEKRVRQFLELLREDCQKQQSHLDRVKKHGEDCACIEPNPNEITSARYPTSANVPVA